MPVDDVIERLRIIEPGFGRLGTDLSHSLDHEASPQTCCINNGVILEALLRDLWGRLQIRRPSNHVQLDELFRTTSKALADSGTPFPLDVADYCQAIRLSRNRAAHYMQASADDAQESLRQLVRISEWYFYEYCGETAASLGAAAAANTKCNVPAASKTTKPNCRLKAKLLIGMGVAVVVVMVALSQRGSWSGTNEMTQAGSTTTGKANESSTAAVSVTPRRMPDLIRQFEIHIQRADDQTGYDELGDRHVPLKNFDKLQFHIELNQSAYFYLFWFDELGRGERTWPRTVDDQLPVQEIWEPPLARDGEKQKWHAIGGSPGLNTIIAATSQRPLAEEELPDITSARLDLVWNSESKGLVPFELAGRPNQVTRPEPTDGSRILRLELPADTPGRIVQLRPEPMPRPTATPHTGSASSDFRDFLDQHFSAWWLVVIPQG